MGLNLIDQDLPLTQIPLKIDIKIKKMGFLGFLLN